MKLNSFFKSMRKWSRTFHKDLSFIFTGVVIVYAISGLVMNHKHSVNPYYSIERSQFQLSYNLPESNINKADLMPLLEELNEEENYTKHYFPEANEVKIFLKKGSNIVINTESNEVTYEKLTQRLVIGSMTRLHYNPGRWWTYFADIFSIALILIVITGLTMLRAKAVFKGRAGLELLIGILIPIIFLLF